jgi:hypothetical protein
MMIGQNPRCRNWPEPAFEMCLRAEHYDQEITLLHFDKGPPPFEAKSRGEDVFDRFVANGQLRVR